MNESMRNSAAAPDQPMSPDEIGWDPDDAPELDAAWFEQADIRVGGRLVERGHRPGDTERLVLPTNLVERFRSGGPDWQIRIETALKEWLNEHPDLL
ncbi:BrnA antitoxin family protein [Methylobacterium sp. WL120]|uniref:BrnA antitoxin family protein n=1 Tax=Methylobacterium sp. WL120 TaxID=2603887 RepID=UPI001AEEDCA0|nr:BrnA antitoxin family protein [Methylobacterium sp. WL120]